ncbi:fungal-specific transcription factor domain-containing protein [Sordaria brevicollis]|uniref:Fungal-specific transcription factor domain-containing protein n=1 Tax=Sordaria brevicollis TaxID=83679 RepID=A0AAE0PIV9_SORBR|nr:fungal-specific transcription factor domain-containing protein [Sordaria brevicollis]
MPSGQRSKSGCWTCRLRRKKCLEGGPPCSNCESRNIFCHGYGPKPNWKDRGDKEREEATRLQLQTRRRRRSTATQSHASHPSVSESSTSSGGTIDICSPPVTVTEPASLSPFLVSNFSFPLSPSPGHERNGAVEFEYLDALTIAPDSFTAGYSDDIWMAQEQTDAVMAETSSAEPLVPQQLLEAPCQSTQTLEGPTPLCLSCLGDSSTGIGMRGPPTSENDIELVMHFIGETCPLQHGSYRSSSATQRSWALFLLMRSPTFYHASLSMSAYHMSLILVGRGDARAKAVHDYQSHRAQALDSFCRLTDPNRQCSGSVFGEKLICSVQLALLEALGKNMQSCHSYLASAVQILLEDLRQPSECETGPAASSPKPEAHQHQLALSHPSGTSNPTPLSPSPMERTALSFFRAILVWNDILSSSSLKKIPFGAPSYRELLASPSFCTSFEATTGCEAWILVTIMDATALEEWKRDQENQGNLSIRELVNRASRLEDTVEASIKRLEMSGGDKRLQSLVFAYALLTHLHAIVSGPLVSVPEISESIERSIVAWKMIPDSTSPRSLAWPYCVCASLATGKQREVFEQYLILDRLSSVDSTLGSLRELKAIVEECWKEVDGVRRGSDFVSQESSGSLGRDRSLSSSSVRVDWREIMQRSNLGLLFI